MPIEIEDLGTGNSVEIAADSARTLEGRLRLAGNNIRVRLGPGCSSWPGMLLVLGDRCSLDVGSGCALAALGIDARRDGHVHIGTGTGFTAHTGLHMAEPSRVRIGHGSLFAAETLIFTSDMHSILDVASGRRINPARDVVIGHEVWVGQRAVLLKGVTVGAGSVIGFGAVVSRDLPENCLAAGSPAAVVRRGIRWRHDLIP